MTVKHPESYAAAALSMFCDASTHEELLAEVTANVEEAIADVKRDEADREERRRRISDAAYDALSHALVLTQEELKEAARKTHVMIGSRDRWIKVYEATKSELEAVKTRLACTESAYATHVETLAQLAEAIQEAEKWKKAASDTDSLLFDAHEALQKIAFKADGGFRDIARAALGDAGMHCLGCGAHVAEPCRCP